MEYEINPQIKIIVGILIVLFIISGIPFKLTKDIMRPSPQVNITPNVTPIIIYKTVEVFVTPTPDGIKYFASEYQEGIRKIHRPFSWIRYDVSGLKDMSVHTTVYDYKIFNSYHWFNSQDYKYYEEFPSSLDKKFTFVFINSYLDNDIGDDTRGWAPNENMFGLQARDIVYTPIQFQKQLNVKELEFTYNYNDNSKATYYGTDKIYSSGSSYASTAGDTYINYTVWKGGKTNGIDGYLVFEIPKNIKDDELILLGSFYGFGSAGWILKNDL